MHYNELFTDNFAKEKLMLKQYIKVLLKTRKQTLQLLNTIHDLAQYLGIDLNESENMSVTEYTNAIWLAVDDAIATMSDEEYDNHADAIELYHGLIISLEKLFTEAEGIIEQNQDFLVINRVLDSQFAAIGKLISDSSMATRKMAYDLLIDALDEKIIDEEQLNTQQEAAMPDNTATKSEQNRDKMPATQTIDWILDQYNAGKLSQKDMEIALKRQSHRLTQKRQNEKE